MTDLRELAQRCNRIGNLSIKPGERLHKLEADLLNRRPVTESPPTRELPFKSLTIVSNINQDVFNRR